MRVLQSASAVLGLGSLCSSTLAGTGEACLLLAPLQNPAAQWQHSGVCPAVNPLISMAHKQGGFYCHLWVVHLGRGMAAEFYILQALPRLVQVILGRDFHCSCQALDDSHRILPFFPTPLSGCDAGSKTSWSITGTY
jgi:hypothetical protein